MKVTNTVYLRRVTYYNYLSGTVEGEYIELRRTEKSPPVFDFCLAQAKRFGLKAPRGKRVGNETSYGPLVKATISVKIG